MQQPLFRVVDLGSHKMCAFDGYNRKARNAFGNGSRFEFVAVDRKKKDAIAFLRHGISQKTSNFLRREKHEATLSYVESTLPACMRHFEGSSVSQVHFHMFSGELSEARIGNFLHDISRVLVRDGLLFVSLDEQMFSDEMMSARSGRVLAVFDNMLGAQFKLIFRSFLRNRPENPQGEGSVILLSKELELPPMLSEEAVKLSASFGVPLSTRKPWVFFRQFSECAERFGYYFAIAKKE